LLRGDQGAVAGIRLMGGIVLGQHLGDGVGIGTLALGKEPIGLGIVAGSLGAHGLLGKVARPGPWLG
jgi:hypothetical protein